MDTSNSPKAAEIKSQKLKQAEPGILSDDEKQKIRSEEIYRYEVREELQAKHKPKRWYEIDGIVWKILNSSIAIFFLGSVVVTSITIMIDNNRQALEREIALDNQQDETLNAYFDQMTELLLEQNLRSSLSTSELRDVARIRTLTVLKRLDPERKGTLLQFLYESDLIGQEAVIDLSEVDLRETTLIGANLREAELSGANLAGAILREAKLSFATMPHVDLSKADLRSAILSGADLRFAMLSESDLTGADLRFATLGGADLTGVDFSQADMRDTDISGANLSGADLSGATLILANLSEANLSQANLRAAELRLADLSGTILTGAEYDNNTKWPPGLDLGQLGAIRTN